MLEGLGILFSWTFGLIGRYDLWSGYLERNQKGMECVVKVLVFKIGDGHQLHFFSRCRCEELPFEYVFLSFSYF